jgi:TRAP-type mannitol/chloroaromatic compound transport system substrate-binding protein
MDRRTFLRSSTAAAALSAGAAVEAPAPATPERAPSTFQSATSEHRWRVTRPSDPLLRDQAERLLAQITQTTAGAIAFDWHDAAPEPRAKKDARSSTTGEIDAAFGLAPDLLADPGLALFTGLPGPFALAPEDAIAWHTVHGGGAFLDEIAGTHGVKVLLAGHTGTAPGLWADRDITDLRDAAMARTTSSGLGQLVWDQIRASFPSGTAFSARAREFPADPACALRDARTAGLTHFFRDGLHDHGIAVSFIVSADAWSSLAPSLKTLIETTAHAALHEAVSMAAHHREAVLPALAKAGIITPRPLPDLVRKAIDHVSLDLVGEHLARDPQLVPAWSAYEAFHHQRTGRRFPRSAPASHTS